MSWYGEYGTVPSQKSQSPEKADIPKSKKGQSKKHHPQGLGKSYGERSSQLANGDNHVALATNGEKTSTTDNHVAIPTNGIKTSVKDHHVVLATTGKKTSTTERGSEGSIRLPSLGTVLAKGINPPLAPPSTPENNHQQTAQDESKTELKNPRLKLPQIKITQDTTDYLKPPQGISNSNNSNPTLKSSTVHLPSLSISKPKPKTANKHWRKRVTLSWSEGGASRVVIEEDKKRVGNRESSRDKRQLTREHLRRFMMNERRELRKK